MSPMQKMVRGLGAEVLSEKLSLAFKRIDKEPQYFHFLLAEYKRRYMYKAKPVW